MNLSAELHPMVGRRKELDEGRRLLASGARLVTLTGPGGVGKTRLARALVGDRSQRDPVLATELSGASGAAHVTQLVAEVVGTRVPYGALEIGPLVAALEDRRALLLVDGCEHVLDATAELVSALLGRCPELRVLTTSRQPLGITGEVVFPVAPLSLPGPHAADDPATLMEHEAVAFFVERATAVSPTFKLVEANAGSVVALCAALDGVPLALELAAARISVLSPQGILDRLDDYRVLNKGARDAPSRQQSLRASLQSAFELCTDDERALWSRLTVFAGGFDLEAAETVCSGDSLTEYDVLDLVDALLEKSVLVRDDADATHVRYRMPETIRRYGVEQLPADEQAALRARHLDWCSERARVAAAEWFGTGQREARGRLRAEHNNLREAFEYALATAAGMLRVQTAVLELEGYWLASGRLGEALHWLAVSGSAQDTDARVSAVAAQLSALARVGGLPDPAPDGQAADGQDADGQDADGQEADNQGIDGATDGAITESLLGQALTALADARPADGVEPARRAAEMSRDRSDTRHDAKSTLVLGICAGLAGDVEQAHVALTRCRALTTQAEEFQLQGYATCALALLASARGDTEDAAELFATSLRCARDLDEQLCTAMTFEAMAWTAAESDPERAATLLGAADAAWQRLGMRPAFARVVQARTHCEELLKAALRDRTYVSLRRRGAGLPSAMAIAFALGEVLPVEEDDSPPTLLTRRELEVASLVGRGMSNRDIAAELFISERTAQGHVENILRKLGFTSRTQVAAWVAERDAARRSQRPHLFAIGDQ